MKKFFTTVVCLYASVYLFGQQEAQYSQYLYNQNIVNPAYVTDSPLFGAGILYRTQWVGIEGAPQTGNVFAHIPFSERVELGFNYVNDQIGDVLTTHIFNADFAYKTQLTRTLKLSYGLKLGATNNRLAFNTTDVAADPAFTENNKTTLSVGAGTFLFTDKFYVGLSSPNLLPNETTIDGVAQAESEIHAYVMGGYVFDVSEEVKLKPSAIIKHVIGAPLTFDTSLNALFMERFEVGVSYRYQDAVVGLAAVNITPDLRLGYSYDYTLSELQDFNNGSHEIILLYNFDLLRFSKQYTSPRFF